MFKFIYTYCLKNLNIKVNKKNIAKNKLFNIIKHIYK